MDFITAVKTCFQKYFDFSGRARRSEFWWWMLFSLVVSFALMLVDIALFSGPVEDIGPFETTFSLITLFPTLAVTARRLHDTDRSGWWQILPLAPAIVLGLGIGLMTSGSNTVAIVIASLGGVLTLGTVVLLIVWLATDGHRPDNQHGQNPKYGGQATAFD